MPSQSSPPERPSPKEGGARDFGSAVREAAPLLGLGTTLAVTVLAGVGAGYWLDGRLGTAPVFLLLGSCLGIGAAMYHFFRAVTGSTRQKTGPRK